MKRCNCVNESLTVDEYVCKFVCGVFVNVNGQFKLCQYVTVYVHLCVSIYESSTV